MTKYKSWSDTAHRGFEDALRELGIRFSTNGRYVTVLEDVDVSDLALEFSMTKKVATQ
jgi:hypothetical protein